MVKHPFLDHTEKTVFTQSLNEGKSSLKTYLIFYNVFNKPGDKRLAINRHCTEASSKLLPDTVCKWRRCPGTALHEVVAASPHQVPAGGINNNAASHLPAAQSARRRHETAPMRNH